MQVTAQTARPLTRHRDSIKVWPRRYDLDGLPARFFNTGELERLLALYETARAGVIVEFGCNNGRTAAAALRNIASITRYIGIDVAQGYVPAMPCQRHEVPAEPGALALGDPRFELRVSPRGGFDLSPGDLPACDAVFIDADHSRAGVVNDYALARSIVKKGGLIIFHDDNCLPVVEVTQTLNEFCDAGAPILHVTDTWLAYERV